LGFIGTVLGLAQAVSNFGALSGAGDKVNFDAVLPQVTGGLATAFETTLIALVLALLLQVFASFQTQNELTLIAEIKSKVMLEKPTENTFEASDSMENTPQ
jgi:biopolymer transport protein ExbB/TolQ